MYVLTPDELFELLKLAVPEPNLTIETIAQLLYQYRDGNLPVKQSTADMNKALGKIGIQGKGNRGIRGELCICFVHMKMWNRHDVPLGVVELCKRYDLDRFDVERDPYFRRYCYYLCPVLDIVEPGKHREFIIQDVLVPLSGARGIKYITGSGKEASRTMIRYKAFEIESHWFRPKTLTMIDGIERRPSPRPTDGGLIKKRSMQFIANPALKIKLNCNQKFPDQSLPLASGLLRIDRTDYLTGDTISTTNTNLTTNTTSTTTASNNLNAYKTYVVWENVVEFQKGKRKAYSSYPRNKKPKLPPGYSQNPDSCQTSSNSNNSNYNTMYTNKEVLNNTNEEEKQKRSLYYTNNYEYTPPANEDSQYVHNPPQYVHNPQHYVVDSQPGPQYIQNISATTGMHYVTPENSQEQCAQEYSEESQRNQLSTSPLPHHNPTQQQQTSKPSKPGLFASYADALFDAQLAVHHQQRQYNLMMNCNHYSPHYIEPGGYSSHYMIEGGYNKPSFYPSKDGFIAIPHTSESNYPTGRYAPSVALSMGNEMWKRGVQQGSAAAAGVDRVMYMQSDYGQRTPAPTTAFADRGMMYHALPPHVAADRGMMKYMPSDHAPPVLAPSPVEHEDDELLQACADALVKIGYNVHKTRVKSDLLLTQCGV